MSTYRVTVHREEEISFDVEAVSADEAADRYLAEGDEIHSETVRVEVVHVEEVGT